MTVATQVQSPVEAIRFEKFSPSGKEGPIEKLAADYGIVHVTSITRDGCSGCAEQKPLFRELAGRLTDKHAGKVRFYNIHVSYSQEHQQESLEAKRLLHHAAYPTYMVHVRSRVGPLEVYRAIYPSMEELEKQVVENLELAEYYKTDAEKSQP